MVARSGRQRRTKACACGTRKNAGHFLRGPAPLCGARAAETLGTLAASLRDRVVLARTRFDRSPVAQKMPHTRPGELVLASFERSWSRRYSWPCWEAACTAAVVPPPAPPVTSAVPSDRVVYPEGRGQHYGDGGATPYYWVWIPSGTTPPTPPIPPHAG